MDIPPPDSPIFCRRCSTELHPGRGDLYLITVEAVADPFPPILDDPSDPELLKQELAAQLKELSPQEAMDSVHRKTTFFLCRLCYQQWIEDPTG